MRRKARVDSNHAEIVAAFRSIPGVSVLDLSRVGAGCPDILISHRRVLSLVEIKDGSKPPSKRKLTPDQAVFHSHWPVYIVENVEGVYMLLGIKI